MASKEIKNSGSQDKTDSNSMVAAAALLSCKVVDSNSILNNLMQESREGKKENNEKMNN